MKEPVRSILAHPGTMARDAFLLSFLSSRSWPLSSSRFLSSAYTESPSSPLCVTVNHERARGPGRPRVKKGEEKEEKEEEEEEAEEGGDEKGPESGVGTKEGDEEEDAERRRIYSSLSRAPLSPCLFLLYSVSFISRRHPFLILDLFRASTIYLRASNKKK